MADATSFSCFGMSIPQSFKEPNAALLPTYMVNDPCQADETLPGEITVPQAGKLPNTRPRLNSRIHPGSTLTRRLETLFKPRLQSREPRLGTTAVESVLALKLVGGLLSLRLRFLPGFHRAFQTEQHWVWVKTCENLVHLIRLHLDFFNQSSWIARTYSLSNPATTGTPKQPTNNLLDEM